MFEVLLHIKNLSYRYPDRTVAINNITFDVKRHEKLAIIGPNGAGKSTLLTCLNGVRSAKGEIVVDGIQLTKQNLNKIRQKLGLVFQNPDDQLFCNSVLEDVAFGPLQLGIETDEVFSRVKDALIEVGLPDHQKRHPSHLSFGERKSISIATVLSMNPAILILDEPSSNLDPKRRRKLIQYLKNFKKTLIIATHDLDMVLEVCHIALILNKGEISAEGKVNEILSDEILLKKNDLELPLSLAHRDNIKPMDERKT